MKQPAFDFIGRSRTWAIVSGSLVALSLLGILVNGFNLSIDFSGGTSFTVEGIETDLTAAELNDIVADAGGEDVRSQMVTAPDGQDGAFIRLAAIDIDGPVSDDIEAALAEATGSTSIEESFVGPTWGEAISQKAVQALIVFLVVVMLYISVRLQPKMAGAAVLALVHDIAITVGVYAWFGFTVSPNTVIALLTILGYSLYDTFIVFDRIEENTTYLGEPGRRTYAQVVNTSQNEVLWRSINTSLTSLLPVGALLFIGSGVLGADTLQDLALALFIGMALGSYSSLFVAGPALAWWVGREPEMATLTERYAGSDEEVVAPSPQAAAAHRRPVTTEYVRGQGKRKRRSRR